MNEEKDKKEYNLGTVAIILHLNKSYLVAVNLYQYFETLTFHPYFFFSFIDYIKSVFYWLLLLCIMVSLKAADFSILCWLNEFVVIRHIML